MLCVVATVLCVVARNHVLCCCLLLQDLVDSGAWKGEDDSGGLVLWDMVSVCMCVCLQVCLSEGDSGLVPWDSGGQVLSFNDNEIRRACPPPHMTCVLLLILVLSFNDNEIRRAEACVD